MKTMRVHFLTTTNHHNGYGMTREYFKKYLPPAGVELEPEFNNQDICLILHIPPAIQHAKAKIKVLYTMIEGDTVPDSWHQYLKQADHIIVPTKFVQEAFKRAGFESTVINLGYDQDIFKPFKRPKRDVFTFLHYEAFQDRKGWQDLLDSWHGYMHELEGDAQLILKTIKPWYEIPEDVRQFNNVRVITGELPHRSLYDILCDVDCFVFPSRGEGFSLPPIEAMATCLPVIISKGHSHMEYYDERYMYGVDATIKIPARYPNWEDQGSFVRCDLGSLEKTLKHVYMHQDEARAKGDLASNYVKKFSYENTAQALSEFLWRL